MIFFLLLNVIDPNRVYDIGRTTLPISIHVQLFYLETWLMFKQHIILLQMGQLRPLFGLFSFFFKHKFYRKTVDFSEIRTRIDGVEGEHSDHLTTTAALQHVILNSLD